jgi:O-antigen/teichoic acid export membrane protein
MQRWLQRLFGSTIARNTFWVFLGQGTRLVIQGGYFVVIARVLGVNNYGSFVGAVALVAILSPFATLGFGNLLVKNVARDRETFPECWGNTLLMTVVSGSILLAVVMFAAKFVLPASIPTQLVFAVAISDLFAARLTDAAGQAFQSVEQVRWMANVLVFLSLVRFVAALAVAFIWKHPTPLQWGYFYCGSSTIPAAVSVLLVSRRLGMPRINLAKIYKEITEGFYFSTGLSAQTIYNDLDKAMLARYSTLDATGLYAAAYRIIDVAYTPVRSLLYAASPGFFRAGHSGIEGSLLYMKRLLPKGLIYSLLILAGLQLIAPLVPRILGSEYIRSVEALRWLAVLPLIRTVHSFYSDALTGAGYQGIRMALQVFVAVFNIVINLWLIPAYSWRGAVYSSLASDVLLAIIVVAAACIVCRIEPRRTISSVEISSV